MQVSYWSPSFVTFTHIRPPAVRESGGVQLDSDKAFATEPPRAPHTLIRSTTPRAGKFGRDHDRISTKHTRTFSDLTEIHQCVRTAQLSSNTLTSINYDSERHGVRCCNTS